MRLMRAAEKVVALAKSGRKYGHKYTHLVAELQLPKNKKPHSMRLERGVDDFLR